MTSLFDFTGSPIVLLFLVVALGFTAVFGRLNAGPEDPQREQYALDEAEKRIEAITRDAKRR